MEYASPTLGEARVPLAVRMPQYARINAGTAAPTADIASQPPAMPAVPDWAMQAIGDRPGTRAIAESLRQIRNYLLPLGDAGYRIITTNMLFAAQNGSELVEAVLAAISARREGYLALIGEMEAPGYDYLEPLKALQDLMPFADRDVRAVLGGELRRRQADAEAEATAGLVLGIMAALLTIFPPTAPVGLALGAGLGLAAIGSGYREYEQGQRFEMGTGAGIFTREQEDAARMMQVMGIVNMTLGAISVAASGLEVVRIVRAPISAPGGAIAGTGEAVEEIVAVEARAGSTTVRVEALNEGAPAITVTQAEGTAQRLTAGEVQALAEPQVAAEIAGAAPGAADEFAGFQSLLREEGALGPVRAEGDIVQLQPHGWASVNRAELGFSGRHVQSAHGAAQSYMRGMAGYSADAALTRLMDRAVHTGMDRYWKQAFQAMRRAGRTNASALEVHDIIAESIRMAPGLPAGEAQSLIARLSDEMFVEFGLLPTDVMPLPYPNIGP
jgi:hypothetical protein